VNGTAFFDTNIFIYADDDRNRLKQEIEIGLVASYTRVGKALLSPQVLQEYFSIATKSFVWK
jgi:predicted nucleic acid-binding protein